MPHDHEQTMTALAKANAVRFQRQKVKRELREGAITLLDALADPATQSMMVLELLAAQHGWASRTAIKTMTKIEMGLSVRVCDLSGYRRVRLADVAGGRGHYGGAARRRAAA